MKGGEVTAEQQCRSRERESVSWGSKISPAVSSARRRRRLARRFSATEIGTAAGRRAETVGGTTMRRLQVRRCAPPSSDGLCPDAVQPQLRNKRRAKVIDRRALRSYLADRSTRNNSRFRGTPVVSRRPTATRVGTRAYPASCSPERGLHVTQPGPVRYRTGSGTPAAGSQANRQVRPDLHPILEQHGARRDETRSRRCTFSTDRK